MERKGIKTDRGNINRQAEITNSEMRQLRARIRKVKDWLYAQPLENTPTIISVMSSIASGRDTANRWQKVRNLQTQANVLMFLQKHNITDMEQLVHRITQINEEYREVSEEIKKVDRKIDLRATHLYHYEVYKKNKPIYDQHAKLPPKQAQAFFDKHYQAIQVYEAAREHLKGVQGANKTVPVKTWEKEIQSLTSEKTALTARYYSLQDEVKSVEQLRKGTENIMREEARDAPTRRHDIEH